MLLLVGDDWSEEHHDVELQDGAGRRLGKARLPEGIAGISRLHAMIGEHVGDDDESAQVVVGIETERGPWVQALVAAGYQVYPINPLQVAAIGNAMACLGPRAMPGMPIPSPTWCAPIAISYMRSLETVTSPRRLR